ncbi:ABC transporter substrate-binding protein [Agromyces mediolanus]|nr:ABC transporter substrate-binding protein [Agromyces mediolanus]
MSAAILLAAGTLSLTACGSGVSGGPAADGAAAAVTIMNCGREVGIASEPTAVVGMSPSQTELLLRLGLADRLVGQAQTATAPLPGDLTDEAAGIPVLSETTPPSREELLRVEPDFVFSPTTYEFTAEQGFASLEQLDEAGVAAYVATGGCFDRRMAGTVDDLFVDLKNLGEIFGVQDAADGLIQEGAAQLAEIETAVAGRELPRVAQVYVEGSTLSAIGAGIEYDIVRLAGGDNVFSPDDPQFADFFAAQISPESLAALDPDALVFAVADAEQERATVDYLTRTFPTLSAVRQGRLIPVSAADTFPGTLGNISVVREIAEQLHPDAFDR